MGINTLCGNGIFGVRHHVTSGKKKTGTFVAMKACTCAKNKRLWVGGVGVVGVVVVVVVVVVVDAAAAAAAATMEAEAEEEEVDACTSTNK